MHVKKYNSGYAEKENLKVKYYFVYVVVYTYYTLMVLKNTMPVYCITHYLRFSVIISLFRCLYIPSHQ